MLPQPPRIAEWLAPASWRCVDFISDLHLHASEPATLAALQRLLRLSPADAVFILGDLFDVWVGDDGPQGDDAEAAFERAGLALLHQTAQRRALFFMAGNRDFLLGPAAAAQAGLQPLEDPTVLSFGSRRWLLSHGDALCLQDQEYLRFRAQVRAPQWQGDFLARPLAERRAIARELRAQSEARKRSGAMPYADADAELSRQWLRAAGADTLIHGHTHLPTEHDLGEGMRRLVLSDWDLGRHPPRAQALRLKLDGAGGVRMLRWDVPA